MNLAEKLNDEQIKPVLDTEGQVLVLAGAGSGKTRVLTYRIAHLIKDLGVKPYNILAITFTNKAAKEMRERVNALVGENCPVWVSTFHSFCARILRSEIEKIGYGSNFTIYSETETDRVIKNILDEEQINDKNLKSKIKFHISNAKNGGYSPLKYKEKFDFEDSDLITDVFIKYEKRLKNNNALDFDDLLLKTLELFLKCDDVLEKYSEKFRYVHVDEFQDTNKIQYMLVRLLSNKYKNIFVVGDEDQSIYGWRGAEISNILDFKKNFPDAKIYKLERNYRSTSSILSAANSIIKNNSSRLGKTLWTDIEKGMNIQHRRLYTDREEAEFTVREIHNLVIDKGYSYGDFAILVRLNSLTRLFEEKPTLYSIPYRIYGGFKFYERKEVKDILAYLRIISNPNDNEALSRIINFPKRGIGESSIVRIIQYADLNGISMFEALGRAADIEGLNNAAKIKILELYNLLNIEAERSKNLPLNEFIRSLITNLGIEKEYSTGKEEDTQRLENTYQLADAAREFIYDNEEAKLEDFLQSVSLISDIDSESETSCVTLATVHSVKGLEFKVVFIVGLEEGIFPSSKSVYEKKELEEERRVMYVAVTRAMEILYLTSATSRFRFNKTESNAESRFVKEALGITDDKKSYNYLIKQHESKLNSDIPVFESAAKRFQSGFYNYVPNPDLKKDLSEFIAGVKVRHNRFGEGVILAVRGEVADIKFEKLGIKAFNLTVAPLEIIK